jgi:putative cell wall-binding protein
MARRRRITSVALSTLAVAGGLATALPASASAAAVVAQTPRLAPAGIVVSGGVDGTGVFDGSMYPATNDAIGMSPKYVVDWGDNTPQFVQIGGTLPTSQAPLALHHQYASHGIFKITVTVDEDNGAGPVSQTLSTAWRYAQAPTDPILSLTSPSSDAPFTAEARIGDGSVDPAATKSYAIDWGDGSPVQIVAVPGSGQLTVQHVYPKTGVYWIAAHTTDGVDTSSAYNEGINFLEFTANGLSLSAHVVSTGNVELDPVFYGAPLAPSHQYEYYIDWGDGSPVDKSGIDSTQYHMHDYAKVGTYTISVKAADDSDPDNPALHHYTATTSIVIDSTESQTHSGGLSVDRLWGTDRYQTSVAVAGRWVGGSADAVVLARGDAAPDALAGVPFAAHVNGPLLLTTPTTMPEIVRVALDHATGGPKTRKTVYILGGLSAVSQQQEDTLRTAGYTVVRIGGATRYDTALRVAARFGATGHVIVATGLNFPDALAAGPLGAAENAPIVLSADAATDPATAAFIRQHSAVDPVGGQAQKAVAALNTAGQTVDRTLAGANRYATAVAVATRYAAVTGHTPTEIGLASGASFPDALSGGAYAAKVGMPLVLTDPNTLSPDTLRYISGLRQAKSLQSVEIFGGGNAVSRLIQELLQKM